MSFTGGIADQLFNDWRDWFKSKGTVWQEIVANALGKVVAVGILKGTIQVADCGDGWTVKLPKELVNSILEKRFP